MKGHTKSLDYSSDDSFPLLAVSIVRIIDFIGASSMFI